MGQMLDGPWVQDDRRPPDGDGAFRHRIDPGGRYHLPVSLACPWAHRTMVVRVLKRLEPLVGMSVTHWLTAGEGWNFDPDEGVVPDPLRGVRALRALHARADPHSTGRVSVPVLWDAAAGTLVNTESSGILRILAGAFAALGARPGDMYPPPFCAEIDAVNARICDTLNDGVHRCGFARSQQANHAAIRPLFATLDWLEDRLSRHPFLCGEWITEADGRLWTALIRCDAVYLGHFECNLRRIVDDPALRDFTRSLCQVPGIAGTVSLAHMKRHDGRSHRDVNPSGIVPAGPVLDLSAPGTRTMLATPRG